ARSNPHPHCRRPQPGAEARPTHGATPEIDGGAKGRSTAAARAGRYTCRTRAQLWRRKEHDFKDQSLSFEGSGTGAGTRYRSTRPLPFLLHYRDEQLPAYFVFAEAPINAFNVEKARAVFVHFLFSDIVPYRQNEFFWLFAVSCG